MLILMSIFILIIGIIMLIKPDIWWQMTESWKSYSDSEPSDAYVKITRIGGIFFAFVATFGIIAYFVL